MLRERHARRTEAAEEDDLLDARPSGSTREVIGADDIEVGKAPLRELRGRHHVVNEIDRILAVLEGVLCFFQGKQIAPAVFGKPITPIPL
jgi:hypothetical protein